MAGDWRADVASYYDLAPNHPADVPFYLSLLESSSASLLELGCGTGRVTTHLAAHADFVLGVDNSRAMLDICRRKLTEAGVPASCYALVEGDITDLRLHRKFDLIVAPFRVLQHLSTDEDVAGLMRSIKEHLEPAGTAVLNAFRPKRDAAGMLRDWPSEQAELAWEVEDGDTVVRSYDHRLRVQEDPLVLFKKLIYRRFRGDEQVDEAVLKIAMRCYYPEDLLALVESAGFIVKGKWGGYSGESYGVGPELVAAFGHAG